MKIVSAMLADHASTRDGLLYIIGGGINQAVAGEWPTSFPAALAAVVQLQPDEATGSDGFVLSLEVKVTRRSARARITTLTGELRGSQPVGEDPIIQYCFALTLRPIMVPAPDRYTITLKVGDGRGSDVARLPFDLKGLPEGS